MFCFFPPGIGRQSAYPSRSLIYSASPRACRGPFLAISHPSQTSLGPQASSSLLPNRSLPHKHPAVLETSAGAGIAKNPPPSACLPGIHTRSSILTMSLSTKPFPTRSQGGLPSHVFVTFSCLHMVSVSGSSLSLAAVLEPSPKTLESCARLYQLPTVLGLEAKPAAWLEVLCGCSLIQVTSCRLLPAAWSSQKQPAAPLKPWLVIHLAWMELCGGRPGAAAGDRYHTGLQSSFQPAGVECVPSENTQLASSGWAGRQHFRIIRGNRCPLNVIRGGRC